jgi:hypothetical protein
MRKVPVTKVYPALLREIANLIESRRLLEINLAALIEITEYLRQKQLKAAARKLSKP